MGTHEQSVGATDEWYTPPEVFAALGQPYFDLDVAAPEDRRFACVSAKRFITADSLAQSWDGFIWMNPPFGGRNGIAPWLDKFIAHGNGIALTPDRTSAPWWQACAPRMDWILFVKGKIKFIGPDGYRGRSPAQGTCLMSKGPRGAEALRRAAQLGFGFLMMAG